MDLNERKIRILEAIINDYIQTGEPIGSRSIAKKYDLGISSATIRNEMSDLEELGLIIQPYTSAGRVPSDKGYRLYVDKLMHFKKLSEQELEFLQSVVTENINHIDYLMQQTAKALSLLTNYTTVISEPKSSSVKIKHIQLVPLDDKSIIAVIITETKAIKNHVIRVSKSFDMNELNRLSSVINDAMRKYSVYEIKKQVSGLNSIESDIICTVMDAVSEMIESDNDVNLYTSGVKNILEFPEFSDLDKARNIFKAFEEKDTLISLLSNDGCNDTIQILIGKENEFEQLQDCSIIKTNYKFDDDSYGSIGIIGPKRMDYSQTVSVLNAIVDNINHVIKILSGG